MVSDPVLLSFLKRQFEAGMELASRSDVLTLEPLLSDSGDPPSRYIASFDCCSVVRPDGGDVSVSESTFVLGITFAPDHLRQVDPLRVVTWLAGSVFHSNVRPPVVCVGHVYPGVELVDLLYSCFEMLAYLNWSADDALNEEAASWARRHQELFPVERRPLRRRQLQSHNSEGKS